jgi:hypothetical protein
LVRLFYAPFTTQNDVARLLRNDGTPLPPQITLFAGNSLNIKVSGLAPNKRHLILQSSDSALKVVPVKVHDRNIEQSLRLEVRADSIVNRKLVHVEAYVGDAQGRALLKDIDTPRLAVEILPRLELPAAETEAGIMARMLIAENAGPTSPLFVDQNEALESMQWMRHVLLNRLKLGSRHFSVGQAKTLAEIIKARNQVNGFEDYPRIAEQQKRIVDDALEIANNAADARSGRQRVYVEAAFAIARGDNVGVDPCPTGLYAWKTQDSRAPGDNFVKFRRKGGQDFYTLKQNFIAYVMKRNKDAR